MNLRLKKTILIPLFPKMGNWPFQRSKAWAWCWLYDKSTKAAYRSTAITICFHPHRSHTNTYDTSETHLILKSRKVSFDHNINFSRRILLKVCTEHGSITAVLCANFQKDSPTKKGTMDEFRIGLLYWNVTQVPRGWPELPLWRRWQMQSPNTHQPAAWVVINKQEMVVKHANPGYALKKWSVGKPNNEQWYVWCNQSK